MSVIVVKIGTSSLVAPDGTVRGDVLDGRVAELVRLRRQGLRPVLVSSGAIACGLAGLGFAERPTSLPDLQAASAVGQGLLFRRYLEAFGAHDVVPAQVLLTSADLRGRVTYLNARATLERLLALGAIPVVNENDTTATDEVTFGDNDVLAAQIAMLLRATYLVLLTETDGLYVPGPGGGPELLGDVPAGVSPLDVRLAEMADSATGRGGISSKIASAGMATSAGITTVIASATRDGVVTGVARGSHIGTRFAPAPGQPSSAFKLWLTHAKPAMGTIRVDAGAARALTTLGTSLLPVGVTGCDGAFAAGDAVDVVSADGTRVGKGITALSADEVALVAGMKSAEARTVLPDRQEEVIHRDQFVLLADPA